MIWTDRVESVESVHQVNAALDEARSALRSGRSRDAHTALLRASAELEQVHEIDGRREMRQQVDALLLAVAPPSDQPRADLPDSEAAQRAADVDDVLGVLVAAPPAPTGADPVAPAPAVADATVDVVAGSPPVVSPSAAAAPVEREPADGSASDGSSDIASAPSVPGGAGAQGRASGMARRPIPRWSTGRRRRRGIRPPTRRSIRVPSRPSSRRSSRSLRSHRNPTRPTRCPRFRKRPRPRRCPPHRPRLRRKRRRRPRRRRSNRRPRRPLRQRPRNRTRQRPARDRRRSPRSPPRRPAPVRPPPRPRIRRRRDPDRFASATPSPGRGRERAGRSPTMNGSREPGSSAAAAGRAQVEGRSCPRCRNCSPAAWRTGLPTRPASPRPRTSPGSWGRASSPASTPSSRRSG